MMEKDFPLSDKITFVSHVIHIGVFCIDAMKISILMKHASATCHKETNKYWISLLAD